MHVHFYMSSASTVTHDKQESEGNNSEIKFSSCEERKFVPSISFKMSSRKVEIFTNTDFFQVKFKIFNGKVSIFNGISTNLMSVLVFTESVFSFNCTYCVLSKRLKQNCM